MALFFTEGFFCIPGLVYRRSEFLAAWLPTLILVSLMIPSLFNLYAMSSFDTSADITLKIVGHQWYWSCEYSDIRGLNIDIYGKSLGDLSLGNSRLLETTNRIVVPSGIGLRICTTSVDVIHSLRLPRLGIKMDAVPGVLHVGVFSPPLVGVYYGQCSEICGANHTFIPICLEVTTWDSFAHWVGVVLSEPSSAPLTTSVLADVPGVAASSWPLPRVFKWVGFGTLALVATGTGVAHVFGAGGSVCYYLGWPVGHLLYCFPMKLVSY